MEECENTFMLCFVYSSPYIFMPVTRQSYKTYHLVCKNKENDWKSKKEFMFSFDPLMPVCFLLLHTGNFRK